MITLLHKLVNKFSKQEGWSIIFPAQLGPQQLKYIIILSDSSDCFWLISSLLLLLDSIFEEGAEEVEELPICVDDIECSTLWSFTCWWCKETTQELHLHNFFSFNSSIAATVAATAQALSFQLIFCLFHFWVVN